MVRRTRSRAVPRGGSSAQPDGATSHRPPRDDSWRSLLSAWRAARKRVTGMRGDLSCYAAVQVDRARLATSRALARVIGTTMLILVLSGMVVAAAILTMVGAAGGVAVGLGGNLWLANLLTGLGSLALLGTGITIGVWLNRRQRIDRLSRKYARYELLRRATDGAESTDARADAERS